MIIFGLVFPMNILKLQKFRIDQKVHNGIPERPREPKADHGRWTMVDRHATEVHGSCTRLTPFHLKNKSKNCHLANSPLVL
jgi:hypothetical protein